MVDIITYTHQANEIKYIAQRLLQTYRASLHNFSAAQNVTQRGLPSSAGSVDYVD
jgi:hypothetical protein